MCYNVPLYFERKNIKISDIFYLTRQNPHTIITLSSEESFATTIPIKELMLYLPEEDFLNISKGVVLRKNQIVHISDEGLYTMTDGAVFQGRKRNLSQHKQIRKLYLSVILDLCDRRPVAFVYSTRNDNPLVFDTFDKAVATNPGATPLLHSDRGYQYTSKAFRRRILAAGMTQSMSRVARCIDNGPMEGFWGLMKREMYYGKKYKTKEELMLAIEKYIDYYTNKRVQRNLEVLTPLEFHEQKLENVA